MVRTGEDGADQTATAKITKSTMEHLQATWKFQEVKGHLFNKLQQCSFSCSHC